MTGLLGLLFELAVGLWAIKWLLLPAVVIGVPWLTVRAGRAYEARQRIEAWSQAELAWCADQQHAWVLAGDPRGTYAGTFTAADGNRPEVHPV